MSRYLPSTFLAVGAMLLTASTLSAQARQLRICVLASGQLREVGAEYHSATGDTTVAGRPFSQTYPPLAGYAGGQDWYINNLPIEVNSGVYVKYGLPRVLGVMEVSRVADYQEIPVFAEAGAGGMAEIVYVPVRVGCEFQPYQRQISDTSTEHRAPAPIRFSETIAGVLDDRDPADSDDAHFDDYFFNGSSGQTVTIEMRASRMDAYLSLGWMEDGEFEILESNDDGFDSGTDSRLIVELPEDRKYVIRASTLFGGETGPYSLILQAEGGEISRSSSRGQPRIAAGQTIEGRLQADDPTLADGSHYDEYRIDARAGQRVVITMTSPDFDTFLSVGTWSADWSFQSIEANDDGAGMGTDSRLEVTFESAGEYVIQANSLMEDEIGDYRLSVTTP